MKRQVRAGLSRAGCALALVCLVAVGCGPEDRDEPPPGPAPAGDGGSQAGQGEEGGPDAGPGDSGAPQAPVPPVDPAPPDAAASRLVVSFLLDPRITTSVYTGERWVTPETFTLVHDGDVVPVHARAHRSHRGERNDVSATWTPAEPEMVSVSLARAHQVQLTVRRTGQTTLTVTDGDGSTTLTVTASQDAGSWRVDISQ